jgi:MarR family transcriptional regulator, organic hydroperoxide resistance regulator
MYGALPVCGSVVAHKKRQQPPQAVAALDNIRFNDNLTGEMIETSSTTAAACMASSVFALRAAAAHVERALSRALDPFGLTSAQFELLVVIDRHAGSGAGCSELGRQLAAPGPDVTRMLDRLDTAGLVARSRDSQDRRVVHTHLTEKGRDLLELAAPRVAEAEASVFDGLADADRHRLTELLLSIRNNCPAS